jgi:hypothetical protein
VQEGGEVVADAPQPSNLDPVCRRRVEQVHCVLDSTEGMGDAEAAPVRSFAEEEGVSAAKVHVLIVATRTRRLLDPSRSVRNAMRA